MNEDIISKYKKEASIAREEPVLSEKLPETFFAKDSVADVLEHYEKKTKKDMEELMLFMRS